MQNNCNTNIECKTIKLNTVSNCPHCQVLLKLISELNHDHDGHSVMTPTSEQVERVIARIGTDSDESRKPEPKQTIRPAAKRQVRAKAKSNVQVKSARRGTAQAKSNGASRRDFKSRSGPTVKRTGCLI